MQKSLAYISAIALSAAAAVSITAFTKVPANAEASSVQMTIEQEIAAERKADLAVASMQGEWLDPDDMGGSTPQHVAMAQ